MSALRRRNRTQLGCEVLELREVPAVVSVGMVGTTWQATTDDTSTTVEIRQSGANVQIKDVGAGITWIRSAAGVARVELRGGAGNDTFTNLFPTMPTRMLGHHGNDTLKGNDAVDDLQGGDGIDVIRGGDGNDVIRGGDGDDTLIGQGGIDELYGENGLDILVAIDAGTTDYADGGAHEDTIWVDSIGPNADATATLSGDHLQRVSSFANGADRSLNGDRIADPAVRPGLGHTYATFAGKPLFGPNGARQADIDQGSLGDCWLLSGLGALAEDTRGLMKQNVVDFHDGTYGVHLGDSYYRVDNDLPVGSQTTNPVYAGLGAHDSLWVAVVEKAYAHYRSGANTYEDLSGGNSTSVYNAFGSTSSGSHPIQNYANASAMANDVYTRWSTGQSVTVGIHQNDDPTNVPLVENHMYMISSVTLAYGIVTSITLRNPWGNDGGGSVDSDPFDGLVTLTPQQCFDHIVGGINWCTF